jgi:hypothetical protein
MWANNHQKQLCKQKKKKNGQGWIRTNVAEAVVLQTTLINHSSTYPFRRQKSILKVQIAGDRNRTHNLRFTKPLLCQLSYTSLKRAEKTLQNRMNPITKSLNIHVFRIPHQSRVSTLTGEITFVQSR